MLESQNKDRSMSIQPNAVSKKKLKEIWSQVPADYYDTGIEKNFLQKAWHNRKLAQVIDLILKTYKASDRINLLDVGCASGVLTHEVSKSLPKSKVTGLDSYKSAVDFARQKYPNLKFVVGDAHKLPFKNKSFDLIICTETLEHVTDPRLSLLEMKRVLKKNGEAIISMDSGSLLFRIIWHYWTKTKGKVWENAHLHEFNAKLLEELIKESGFRIKKKIKSHAGMSVTFLTVPK